MHVGVEREAEVADVLGRVRRPLERAQQDRLQQREVGARLDALEQARIVGRLRLLAAGELQAELGEEFAQRKHLLRRRHVVHAVERRMASLGEKIARADVGRQHALLDQTMCVVARLGDDARDLAARVELHARLDRLEVDRAAPVPLLQEDLVDLVQGLQLGASRAA